MYAEYVETLFSLSKLPMNQEAVIWDLLAVFFAQCCQITQRHFTYRLVLITIGWFDVGPTF